MAGYLCYTFGCAIGYGISSTLFTLFEYLLLAAAVAAGGDFAICACAGDRRKKKQRKTVAKHAMISAQMSSPTGLWCYMPGASPSSYISQAYLFSFPCKKKRKKTKMIHTVFVGSPFVCEHRWIMYPNRANCGRMPFLWKLDYF